MPGRRGGFLRFLPADLLGWPMALVGAALILQLRVYANRVADGPVTVRLLAGDAPGWLARPTGWLGVALVAAGVALAVTATRRRDPHRWGMVVRYPAFALAGRLLAVAAVLAWWDSFGHVVDVAAGGAEWRFLALPRERWPNVLTAAAAGVAAVACYALSFGPRRLADFAAYAARQRVAASTRAAAAHSSATATGVATQRRSGRASDETGTPPPSP